MRLKHGRIRDDEAEACVYIVGHFFICGHFIVVNVDISFPKCGLYAAEKDAYMRRICTRPNSVLCGFLANAWKLRDQLTDQQTNQPIHGHEG